MPSAIVLHQPGPPENLKFESVTVQEPGPAEIRLRHTAVGVNFHDTYVRSGLYQTLALPGIPGIEGVGVVTELGSEVRDLKVGDRVAYIHLGYGAYSDERILPAKAAVPLPLTLVTTWWLPFCSKGLQHRFW
ncbi:alcohol dehydrogenase catalytic domain-containing protein [Paenalcaligenes niemegkensis]|uniref:alcohol dehydrogenase catalytic domain-containing protein n=1 Tax=Paenalcaligenes niemegkensis TaxID=2895469 RepID=UPI001EE7F1CD|nr:alcohol dehydrogenase catalytic domain-containing protein [Paenalcaligenes niemegkensis]MCQ9616654.1 alcohol dehydrogenase catalytic domain-containing protein [Paenalcaligenes niemegkensis]